MSSPFGKMNRALTGPEVQALSKIQQNLDFIWQQMEDHLPPGRDKTIAQRRLVEAYQAARTAYEVS